MKETDILSAILSTTGIAVIRALPRSKRKAKSIRQLSKICNVPTTTLYRNIKPLLEWNNIGQVLKRGKANYQLFIYLKQDFTIEFELGVTRIVLN